MSLFISLFGGGVNSTTQGATSSGAAGGGWSSMVMLLVMVVAIFLLMILPQRKKDKQKKNMLASVKKGDKVETIGGIRGQVVAVKEQTVILKLEGEAKIEVVKEAIANILNRKPEDIKAPKDKKNKDSNYNLDITPVRKGEEKAEEKAEVVEEKAEPNLEATTTETSDNSENK